MLILGIDPGLQGAVAVYDKAAPHKASVWPMPTKDGGVDAAKLSDLIEFITGGLPEAYVQAAVERVGSRPRQAGAFNFGLSTGIIHGVLASHQVLFDLIPPTVWKPAMGLRRSADEAQSENKERARLLAIKLFPHLAEDLKRKKDDGKAEALLIALYYANREKFKDE